MNNEKHKLIVEQTRQFAKAIMSCEDMYKFVQYTSDADSFTDLHLSFEVDSKDHLISTIIHLEFYSDLEDKYYYPDMSMVDFGYRLSEVCRMEFEQGCYDSPLFGLLYYYKVYTRGIEEIERNY